MNTKETRFDEHLTLALPEGYEFQSSTDDEGKEAFAILCPAAEGEERTELALMPTGTDGAADPSACNVRADFHIKFNVQIIETNRLFFTIRLLLIAGIIEHQRHSYLLIGKKVITNREELESFSEEAAEHLNTVLGSMYIDKAAANAEALTGQRLLEIGELAEPVDEEADKEEQMRLAQANFTAARNNDDSAVSVRAVYKDPITGKTKRDLFWERMGAESGDTEAMIRLGFAYMIGDGVERDPEKAVEYYRQAAELDEPVGQYNMGMQCARGEGIARDFAAAIGWLEKAHDNGDKDAKEQLKLLKDAPEIEKKAYAGDAEAQARFSTILANYPSENNKKESAEMARRSYEQGCLRGYHCLGTRYDYGFGVEKDPVKAAEIYRKGAELGSPECRYCLAVCYKNGSGVPQDDDLALEWAVKAAEQGHLAAAVSVSVESGCRPQPIMPVERIIGYLLKAEEKEPGDVRVAAQLAVQYINLNPCDYEKAIYWYERAAELGDENAAQMAHFYHYRQNLIDEGIVPEDIDLMELIAFLQENGLAAEAFGQKPEPDYDIDELLEGIDDEDPYAIKNYAMACFTEGEKVYDHGIDKERAMRLLLELAEEDAEAAGLAGLIYYQENELEQAEKWLSEAVDGGFEPVESVLEEIRSKTGSDAGL